jgi:hypothetical protein
MSMLMEELDLETAELLPAREVMTGLGLSVCISVHVDFGCGRPCPPPPCYQPQSCSAA